MSTCSLIPMLLVTTIILVNSSVAINTQIINNGNLFIGNTTSKYENQTLNCDNDKDCHVICGSSSQYYTCRNTTINCPSDPGKLCNVTCNPQWACWNLNIHWIPSNPNTLTCSSSCKAVQYPPPTNDNTTFDVNCDQYYECYRTIISCPANAKCDIICSNKNSCGESEIQCPATAPCNIICNGTAGESCSRSIINCPPINQCNVDCIGLDACKNTIVHWENPDFVHVTCPDGGDQCNLIKLPNTFNISSANNTAILNCSEPKQCTSATINCPTNAGSKCIINCKKESCVKAIINCPQDAECIIHCSGMHACYYAQFNGPVNHSFTVYCDSAYQECAHTSIHAEHSSFFALQVGDFNDYPSSHAGTAYGVSIWFPPSNNGIKRTYILTRGMDLNGLSPLQFYALNGWLDINIEYLGDYKYHAGFMHCGENYTYSCPFASNSWSCDENNIICDNPFITTALPTMSSVSPTDLPTAIPTLSTVSPTSNPTKESTNPSSVTSVPTYDPTKEPTNPSFSSGETDNAHVIILAWLLPPTFVLCCMMLFVYIILRRRRVKKRKHNYHQAKLESVHMEEDKINTELTENAKRIGEMEPFNVNVDIYTEWDCNDITEWIMTLEDGIFKEYRDIVTQSLKEENVNGSDLGNVDVLDIKCWGIKDFKHKKKLYEHIRLLVDREGR